LKARDLPLRLSEIHEDGDPEVVVNRDRTVDHSKNGQPVKFLLHRCTEDVELGHKPTQGRNPGHGKEKDRHGSSKERVFESDARIIGDERILFPFLSEKNDHGKGAEVHEGIGHEVEKDPRNSQIIPRDKGNENVSRVGDARVSEHSLNVGL